MALAETYELRQSLARRDEQPPRRDLYPLVPTRRPSNVVIRLASGSGHDAGVVAAAVKQLRKQVQVSDLARTMRRHESYTKPSARKKLKALRARSRERRRVARLARYEARQDRGWAP